MKIKFKSPQDVIDFKNNGTDENDYYHNGAVADSYGLLPFYVDEYFYKGALLGWKNEEYFIAVDEIVYFEVLEI